MSNDVSVWTVPAVAAAGKPETFAVSNLIDQVAIPPAMYGMPSFEATTSAPRVSRREAMQVPAVKRGRDLIAGSLGMLPLVTVKPDLTIDRTSWLMQPEADVPRSVTMTRTAEDLIFEGVGWWKITRFDWRGFPAQVVKLDARTVDVMPNGRVHVTGKGNSGLCEEWPVDSDLIRFDSPNDPLLIAGARAIRQYLLLAKAAQRYADGAPPQDWFSPSEGVDPVGPGDQEPGEYILSVLNGWLEARRRRATGYVPAGFTYNSNPFDATKLQLAEQIQHAVLEIARVMGIDADELGVAVTSRTYANQFDRRKAFLDFTQGGYRVAMEDRLSMRDISPLGWASTFDLDGFLKSDPLARYQAYAAGIEVGAVDRAEIRAAEGKPPLTTQPTPEDVPA